MDGYYRMARGWMDHHIFANDPLTEREAWQWLIERAAFAPHPHRVGQNVVPVERGQLAVSTRYLAQAWQWSKSRVARFLKKLKIGTLIGTADGTGYTVITLCNYDKYQNVKRDGGTASGTAGGTAAGQTIKKEKEGKEGHPDPSGPGGPATLVADHTVPADPKSLLWQAAANLLVRAGRQESTARSMIGSLIKEHGEAKVFEAVSRAVAKGPADPMAYMKGILRVEKREVAPL